MEKERGLPHDCKLDNRTGQVRAHLLPKAATEANKAEATKKHPICYHRAPLKIQELTTPAPVAMRDRRVAGNRRIGQKYA